MGGLTPEVFAELIKLNVQVIVVSPNTGVQAAKRATTSIPIVMVAVDTVEDGLVASLARPGANVTGVDMASTTELAQKWLEVLKEILHRASRVTVLTGPQAPIPELIARRVRDLEAAARSFHVKLSWMEVKSVDHVASVLEAVRGQRPEGLILLDSATLIVARRQIAAFGLQYGLPLSAGFREVVEEGGLVSYGADLRGSWRRAALYVDRILKGAKPADLPVEQPRTFELVINLKTAKALGLTIPQSILVRADQVIE